MRHYCNPRVPLVEAGFGKFLLILSPFVIGGGVISYAKYDKEFRQTLAKNVPGIEPVLEVFIDDVNPFADIQKKMGEYRKKIDETSSSISSSVSGVTSSVTNLFGGDSKTEKSKERFAQFPRNLGLINFILFCRIRGAEVISDNQQL